MAENDVQFIQPPHPIKMKVTKGGPGAITAADLERADKAIVTNLGGQFSEWIADDMKRLDKALSELIGGGPDRDAALVTVSELVHEVRGLGGTFGYDLISVIAEQVFRMLEKFDTVGPEQVAAIRVHLEAMKLIVAERMTGDGGAPGRHVLAGLQGVYRKYV